ncbi:MAG: hypothetical protein AAGA90_11265 [Actinomycetota bacterium]
MNDLGDLVLLAVRLRSRGDAGAVTESVRDLLGDDVERALVDVVLHDAAERGQVRVRGEEGRWSLTPAGEAELNAILTADLTGEDRADVTTGYEAFLPLNRRFLRACVTWQDDPYGLDEFVELVAGVVPITDALAATRHRFAGYGPRLVGALAEAAADPAWIDSPTRDSVHTVWFELHEHLLATLGRSRSEER